MNERPSPPPDWASPHELHAWEDAYAYWVDHKRWEQKEKEKTLLVEEEDVTVMIEKAGSLT